MDAGYDRTWAEINLDNVSHNLREIRKLIGAKTKTMAVVKADAYGHGAVKLSRILLDNGADRLAVACLDEALQLRENGINVPIQVLSRTCAGRSDEVVDNDIIQTVYDLELASGLSQAACKRNKKSIVHVKLDTGMGRMGLPCRKKALDEIAQVSAMPGLVVEGIMTHFASADEADSDYTLKQFELFMEQCVKLEDMGIHIPVKHVANSAATINYPQMHLDMVRTGIAIYGLYTGAVKNGRVINLKPAMTLKARIIGIKQVNEGAYISYGRNYKASRESLVAIIPAGYADGYPRGLSNKSVVMVGGELAPIVGTVCMDHCIADITDIGRDAGVGDEVVLLGGEESMEIAAGKIAEELGTITYEVVCNVGMRVPRIYYEQGKIESISNYIYAGSCSRNFNLCPERRYTDLPAEDC